jgi:hypothetical protein
VRYQPEHCRLLSVECKDRFQVLAQLADQLPRYFAEVRQAGFSSCHVNDDWIEQHCAPVDVQTHKRYLIEFAREVLATGKSSPDFGDEQTCRSAWLNELKAARLATHGPYELLWKIPHMRHLQQLSPGWREFMRVRESSSPADQAQVADQVATFVHRQQEEIRAHSEAIASSRSRLPSTRDELSLQAFFAAELAKVFEVLGARAASTLRRNQALQRDEKIVAAIFEIADDCFLVLLPSVVSSAPAKSRAFEGSLSVGFRLMTRAALEALKFEFGRDTVMHLHELLPNKFNGYGRYTAPEEFCLNILAWTAALRILLPDALQTLRVTAATASTPSQFH